MTQPSPVVLVTGASSGIGQAVADAFVAEGFEVFGTSRNPSKAEVVPGVELVQLDVTDPDSASRAVSTVIQRAGRIDILVNNAGVGLVGAAEESSDAQVQHPVVVARVVLKAATARKPRMRYPAGALARRMSLLRKFAPAATLDRAIRKANKLTPSKRSVTASAGPASRSPGTVNNPRR